MLSKATNNGVQSTMKIDPQKSKNPESTQAINKPNQVLRTKVRFIYFYGKGAVETGGC